MVVGSALAAINDDISTYYVNKESLEESDNLLLELEQLRKELLEIKIPILQAG